MKVLSVNVNFIPKQNVKLGKNKKEASNLKQDFAFSKSYCDSIKSYNSINFERRKHANSPKTLARDVSSFLDKGDEVKAGKVLSSYYQRKGGYETFKHNPTYKKLKKDVPYHNYVYGLKVSDSEEILVRQDVIAYRSGADIFEVKTFDKNSYYSTRKKESAYVVADFATKLKKAFENSEEIDGCIDLATEFYNSQGKSEGITDLMSKRASKRLAGANYRYELTLKTQDATVSVGNKCLGFNFGDDKRLDLEFDSKGKPVYTRADNHNRVRLKVVGG